MTIWGKRFFYNKKAPLTTAVQMTIVSNQSGYEPLNLENKSFPNSDNYDTTNLRF